MSHVVEVDCHIKDLDSLIKAAERLGLEVRDKKTFQWFGKHVGDYPLPTGFTKEDMGHCEFALGIKGKAKAYEIGVCKRRDGKPGYTMLFDFWAGGYGLQLVIGQRAANLRDWYAAEVAKKMLLKKGMAVTIKKTEKGLQLVGTK